ncbi:MAG: transmembrane sensor [Flavobacteriales bacterium]|jgi:transmembrane sensor
MKDEKKILEWINGELTDQEVEDLKKSEDYLTLEKIIHYGGHLQAPSIDAEAALVRFKQHKLEKKESKVIVLNYKNFFKIAAAITLLLTSSYFLFYNTDTTFKTAIAQTQSFQLPDESEVTLNAASKITFHKNSWKENRNLTLEGEAYFQVQKGQTFSVSTKDGIVKVLGTHFNVKQRNNYYEVMCYEGLVSVTYKNKTVKLPPGKTFRVVNKKIESAEDFNYQTPTWMKKESNFDRIPLSQVIAEVERQYNIIIKTESVDTSKLFTGTFTHKNQKVALEAITIPLQLSYRTEGKTITFYNYAAK